MSCCGGLHEGCAAGLEPDGHPAGAPTAYWQAHLAGDDCLQVLHMCCRLHRSLCYVLPVYARLRRAYIVLVGWRRGGVGGGGGLANCGAVLCQGLFKVPLHVCLGLFGMPLGVLCII